MALQPDAQCIDRKTVNHPSKCQPALVISGQAPNVNSTPTCVIDPLHSVDPSTPKHMPRTSLDHISLGLSSTREPKMPRKPSKQSSFTSASSTTLSPTLTAPSASQIPPSLTDPALPLPKLIVFDLDYTLWPFWVDTHVTPPLKPNAAHSLATDRHGEEYTFYSDVPHILQLLPRAAAASSSSSSSSSSTPIKLGVASRTHAPALARDLLKMLHLPPAQEGDGPRKALDVFDAGVEIYPGSKIRHMELLQRRTGVDFDDILFFDDEARNQETESLGLTMSLVRDGVCWAEIEKGVDDWRRRRSLRKGSI